VFVVLAERVLLLACRWTCSVAAPLASSGVQEEKGTSHVQAQTIERSKTCAVTTTMCLLLGIDKLALLATAHQEILRPAPFAH